MMDSISLKLENVITSLKEMTYLLLERQRSQNPDIEHFSGSLTDYPLFIKLFDEHCDKYCLENYEKLKLLINLCDGPAKDNIKYLLLLDEDEDGYVEARETLQEIYGRNDLIVNIQLDGLMYGPKIPPHCGNMLMDLAVRMRQCELIVTSLNFHSSINDVETLTKIMWRLPENLQTEWSKTVERLREGGKGAKFSDLMRFVKNSAVDTNYFGRNVYLSETMRPNGKSEDHRIKKTCSYCSHPNHTLRNCRVFAASKREDKVTFMRRTRRCFNCLRIGHLARYCSSILRCTHCHGHHHNLFHRKSIILSEVGRERPQREEETLADSPRIDSTANVEQIVKEKCEPVTNVEINTSLELTPAVPVIARQQMRDAQSQSGWDEMPNLETEKLSEINVDEDVVTSSSDMMHLKINERLLQPAAVSHFTYFKVDSFSKMITLHLWTWLMTVIGPTVDQPCEENSCLYFVKGVKTNLIEIQAYLCCCLLFHITAMMVSIIWFELANSTGNFDLKNQRLIRV